MHYFLQEDWRQAVRAFREALWEQPREARAWSYLGMSLAHLGQGGEAEAALSRALALAPGDGEAWFHLGVARSLRGEWNPAVSAYRRAVAYLPGDLVAWHRLGVALAECGDKDAATAAFERALVLSRETGAPLPGELPRTGASEHDHLAEAGVREDAREVESWLSLSLALLSLGDEEEAMAAYERAYTIDPERARRSLFRPMLQLLTLAQGEPVEDEADRPAPAPSDRRPRPELPLARPGEPSGRPEVA
jgi:tetratricopeptide (TPR) repeat protein